MAADYVRLLRPTGNGQGAAAYHDKRFALMAALESCETAIYVDADSRIASLPGLPRFRPGISVLPVVQNSVAGHLSTCGKWRSPIFEELASHLGDRRLFARARWCHEALISVTRDGKETRFFDAWAAGADFLQSRGVYSGEGGVIGLAAAAVGWKVNFKVLRKLGGAVHHEGGGPKLV